MLVGAAHFAGREGIVAILRNNGWKVTQLED